MATSNRYPNWLRNEQGVDLLDAVLAPFFVAATFVTGGLATVGLDQPITFYLDSVLYSASGLEVTLATVITFIVLGTAWFSNEATDWDEFNDVQAVIVGGMFALNAAIPLIPALSNAIDSLWYVGIFMVMLNGAGYYLISYW
jgi:hypothetical protein